MSAIQLKPITPKVTPQTDFVENSGRKLLRAPKYGRAKRGNDNTASPIKIMLFGDLGTGKTYTIKDLLELGYKVLVLTTDIGGTGLNAVKIPLRMEGKSHLLDNLVEVVLNGDAEVQEFMEEPAVYFRDIYTDRKSVV